MGNQDCQHTVTLTTGYRSRDPKDGGAVFREVVFGRRPTVADQIKIEADSQSSIAVQEVLLYTRAAVTQFGGLKRLPVPLTVLLQLDDTDREALLEGYVDFMRASLGERVAEPWGEHGFKLALGLEVGGEYFDIIEFAPDPPPLSGHEEVRIERAHGAGVRKDLALVSRETVALAQSDGELRLEQTVEVEALERLDAYDSNQLLRWFNQRGADFRRSRRRAAAGGDAQRDRVPGPTPELAAGGTA